MRISTAIRSGVRLPLLPVVALDDFDYLIKEGEMLTRRLGRKFFLGRHAKRVCRITINGPCYEVRDYERGKRFLTGASRVLHQEDIVIAIRQGIVFARALVPEVVNG